jgi:hypothetical protein
MSLINQLQQVRDQLAIIHQRTKDESSQFQWSVHTALTSIQNCVDTYAEVLDRDTNDDSPYIPALREILPANMDGLTIRKDK